jgi:hypothetical protein
MNPCQTARSEGTCITTLRLRKAMLAAAGTSGAGARLVLPPQKLAGRVKWLRRPSWAVPAGSADDSPLSPGSSSCGQSSAGRELFTHTVEFSCVICAASTFTLPSRNSPATKEARPLSPLRDRRQPVTASRLSAIDASRLSAIDDAFRSFRPKLETCKADSFLQASARRRQIRPGIPRHGGRH